MPISAPEAGRPSLRRAAAPLGDEYLLCEISAGDLFLLRETASELSFSPGAVERERGVVLSELRDRNSFALRNFQDQAEFLNKMKCLLIQLQAG